MEFEFNGKKYIEDLDRWHSYASCIGARHITPLMYLISKLNDNDYKDEFKQFVEDNKNQINATEDKGKTALMLACAANKENMVQILINAGCDINIKDSFNTTALWFACFRACDNPPDSTNIIKMLINSGADVNAQDDDGRTALMEACGYLNQTAISTLIALDDINVDLKRKSSGETAFNYLLCGRLNETEKLNIIKLLIKKSKYKQEFYNIIISRFSYNSFNKNATKLLLNSNINLSIISSTNLSGFEAICKYTNEETIKYCFERHTYYDEATLTKCLQITQHKKVILDILENFYVTKIRCLCAY